eukprot:m.255652 g.255652  ORF g.255652 m.255652 type:complete len:125 (+) comp19164_c0_seq1:55-429(+)
MCRVCWYGEPTLEKTQTAGLDTRQQLHFDPWAIEACDAAREQRCVVASMAAISLNTVITQSSLVDGTAPPPSQTTASHPPPQNNQDNQSKGNRLGSCKQQTNTKCNNNRPRLEQKWLATPGVVS